MMKPMNPKRKTLAIAGIAICLLAVAAISKPGRTTLRKALSTMGLARRSSLAAQQSGDVEQRARARHGWSAGITNSLAKGTLTRYDRNGMATQLANVTIYRKHPDRLRIELERHGSVDVSGFDGREAWCQGSSSITDDEAREIRMFLRTWPDRLFVTRGRGARYREGGRRVEDHRPALPDSPGIEIDPPLVFDVTEVEDEIDGRPGQPKDGRRVNYYVSNGDNTVMAARWLEPIDPTKGIDELKAPRIDIRVDFGKFERVDEVLWPTEVTRWRGGKVDLVMKLSEVKLNQPMPDGLFQKP